MASLFSGTNQGRFTANGQNIFIPCPTGADYMKVYNETVSYATGAGTGAEFYWQLGMAQGQGTIYTKTATTQALTVGQLAAGAGFLFIDVTNSNPGPLNNGSTGISAISTGTPPVVTVGSTAGMVSGMTVQLYNVIGAPQLSGLQFTIAVLSGTTFSLINQSPLAVAATGGSFRVIPYHPLWTLQPFGSNPFQLQVVKLQDPYWYPTPRVIGNISQATQAIVTLLVSHTYQIGETITLHVPNVDGTVFGMPELDNRQAVSIVNINQADVNGYTNTITIDVDTTNIGPFVFPVAATQPFTPAEVVPMGSNTAIQIQQNQYQYTDAQDNKASRGLLLMAGASSPAGVNGNVIDYVVGKSFSGGL
jgi:hypothetical protein